MLTLTDVERAFFTEMRSLTIDTESHEVLVGLTPGETDEYLFGSRGLIDPADDAKRARYIDLDNKHERARQRVLGAEHILRSEQPPIH